MSEILVGEFYLKEQIGAGAMGEVWRGEHRHLGTPVALKFVTGNTGVRDNNTLYQRRFAEEVRAVAGLNHHHIVRVYDCGRIDKSTSRTSNGHFPEESMWLAMELASRGCLEDMPPVRSWPELRLLLLSILDALAHAHARGVIHRDLKPGNILIHNDETTRTDRVLLSDFGIAHIITVDHEHLCEESLAIAAGTPLYMAPEQFVGNWRTYGPWTDLYALGCMTYELVCGKPPFLARSIVEIAHKHTHEAPAPLCPTFLLPDGFESWLVRLMEKRQGHRFQVAADAARSLLKLPVNDQEYFLEPADGLDCEKDPWNLHGHANLDLTSTVVMTLQATIQLDATSLDNPLFQPNHHERRSTERPFLTGNGIQTPPNNWIFGPLIEHEIHRINAEKNRSISGDTTLQSVAQHGTGLFGLRQIPLVDRYDIQHAIWKALLGVCHKNSPSVVVVNGDAGYGKSHLFRHITWRMHELGIAQVLHAVHRSSSSSAEGVPRMLRHNFNAWGLEGKSLFSHIFSQLHHLFANTQSEEYVEWHAAALTHIMSTPGESLEGVPRVRFDNPSERFAVIHSYLTLLTAERPVVLWLDDVQWGLDTVQFVEHMLEHSGDTQAPILCLLAQRNLTTSPSHASAYLSNLLAHRDVVSLNLAALTAPDHRELVQLLLGLDQTLVEQVTQRTLGHPQFAVQLVGDWVSRDVLQAKITGFQLVPGEAAIIPNDISTICLERLITIAQSCASASMDASDLIICLEIAAALGHEVQFHEWTNVCRSFGYDCTRELEFIVDALVGYGIARRHHFGWSFSQLLFSESLEQRARNHRRWAPINRACAELICCDDVRDGRLLERKARFYIAAGDDAEAMLWLSRAITEYGETGVHAQVLALCKEFEEKADALAWEKSDIRRLKLLPIKANSLRFSGRLQECAQTISLLYSMHSQIQEPDLLAKTYHAYAEMLMVLGQPEQSFTSYQHAHSLYAKINNSRGLTRVSGGIGWNHMLIGNYDEALTHYQQGITYARLSAEKIDLAWVLLGIAGVHLRLWDAQGQPHAQEALELYQHYGMRTGTGMALRALGDFALLDNNYHEARKFYEEAISIWESVGAANLNQGYMSLAVLGIITDDLELTRCQLDYLNDRIETIFPLTYRTLFGLIETTYFACTEELDAWGAAMTRLEKLAQSHELIHPVVALLAKYSCKKLNAPENLERVARIEAIADSYWGKIPNHRQQIKQRLSLL